MKQQLATLVYAMTCALGSATAFAQSASTQAYDPAGRYWQSSIAAEARGALDEAQTAIYAYTNVGGDRYLAALRSGWLAYQRKDYEKALRFYKAAIDAAPQALTPRLGQLYAAAAAGRGTEALQAADSVLAIAPGHREATLAAAQMRITRGESARAIEQLRRLHGELPEDTGVLAAYANALNAAGRRVEAEQLQARFRVLTAATSVATQSAR